MKRRLLKWLCCPSCRGDLTLKVSRERAQATPPPPPDHADWSAQSRDLRVDVWDESWSREILDGTLRCACGGVFPIANGIPRVYVGAGQKGGPHGGGVDSTDRSVSQRTRECYAYLWKFKEHRLGWQHKPEDERALFLRNMDVVPAHLSGRVLLDAGCGDGRLTSALADLGMETIGIDLSEGVEVGFANNRSPLVHYIQGDLLAPPLRLDTFDFVWSWGVLHHTRNTRVALEECAKMLRPGGRLFVWLYDKAPNRRDGIIRATQKAPLAVKRLVSRVFGLGNRLKAVVGAGNRVTRTQSSDEVYFWNLDMYGPEFRHLQTQSEVERWFAELGLQNVTPRERMEFGFGISGDRLPAVQNRVDSLRAASR